MTKILCLVALGMVGAGCTKGAQFQVRQAVKENLQATTQAEWERSESHPHFVFEKFREEYKTNPAVGEELCKSLTALSGKELTLFENDIKDAKNNELLQTCSKTLLESLDRYWEEQRQDALLRNNFTFPSNIQRRDTTKGYRALTGDVGPKEVVLTFDDGPHEENTEKVLQALDEVNAKGIFFTLGQMIQQHPEVLKKVARSGHAIGTHSTDHACLANSDFCQNMNRTHKVGHRLSYEEAVAEIRGGHQAVFNLLGFVEPFFRFPYGESDASLRDYLKQKEVAEFYWSVDSEDWKVQDPGYLAQNTMRMLDVRKRGVILFHDIQRRTAEALPSILHSLYYNGYSVVLLQPNDPQARYNSQLVDKSHPLP